MSNYETAAVMRDVRELDPVLLERPETYGFVAVGAEAISEVSTLHGNPAAPNWHSGTREATYMTYHNGQDSKRSSYGHTSTGPEGAGVPRNVLVIAEAANGAAGREVFSPKVRARGFGGACTHDFVQLCGRSALYANGDEAQSAEHYVGALAAAGYGREDQAQGRLDVQSTIFHPEKATQLVDYGQSPESVLEQELVACADMFSPATQRGALGAFEWTLEELGLSSKGKVLHERMAAHGLQSADLVDLRTFVEFVDEDEVLHEYVAQSLNGQAGFHEDFRYSDAAIREACGKGIDELFGGRPATRAKLREYGRAALNGTSIVTLWEDVQCFGEGTLSLVA